MSHKQHRSEVDVFSSSLRFFLAPIVPFIEDDEVSEIMINGPQDIRVERAGKVEKTSKCFATTDDLMAAVRNIAQYSGRPIDSETCTLEARLPDGSRVHAVFPPASRQGLCVTVRKFFPINLTPDDLVERGSLTTEQVELLRIAILLGKNLVIAGGTGSGKTTLLNGLSALIPAEQRVVVLEDTNELDLHQDHVLYFETRPADRRGRGQVAIRDLFHAALRMRPDRIVIGECRGAEAMDLIQALTSGHGGSMTTLHADSPADALNRLETMALMSKIGLELPALRGQIASALHLVLEIRRVEGGVRKVVGVAEVLGLDSDGLYQLNELYRPRFHRRGVEAERTGRRPSFSAEVVNRGLESHLAASRSLFFPGKY